MEYLCSKQTGDFFGEMALMSADGKRSAQVVASGAVKLLVLNRNDFEDYLLHNPTKKERLMAALGQRMDKNVRVPYPKFFFFCFVCFCVCFCFILLFLVVACHSFFLFPSCVCSVVFRTKDKLILEPSMQYPCSPCFLHFFSLNILF